MKNFSNCEMTSAMINLRLKGGIADYKICGYAINQEVNGRECIILQPADLRCRAAMIVPVENVASITCTF